MIVQPVILSGGSGTRLWPLSREQMPKQLLSLCGERSLLQATLLRIREQELPAGMALASPLIVSSEELRFATAEQARQVDIKPTALLLEPAGRNTAPALTAAALLVAAQDPILVVMPADHVIADAQAFARALAQALPLAAAGRIVTLGVPPSHAETGYGYIQQGAAFVDNGLAAHSIARFVEKPDREEAAAYLAAGGYFWNSGIFVLRASVWLQQIETHRADIASACRAAFAARTMDQDFIRLGAAEFAACPADSIDYAVMEKLDTVGGQTPGAVIPLAAGWSDVGAWQSLWEIGQQDEDGNVVDGDVLALDTCGSLLRSETRLLVTLGIEDMVVVETPDAILVARREDTQRLREAVARLKAAGRSECVAHRKIYRPWGYYDSVDAGQRFQVKRIVVAPGAALSLQMHHHRAEHWVVVCGTARVTCGEKSFLLAENESTFIPVGTRHRLENPGMIPLEIIEVQSGAYLGEDDIVRYVDTYGREAAGDA